MVRAKNDFISKIHYIPNILFVPLMPLKSLAKICKKDLDTYILDDNFIYYFEIFTY